MSAIDFIGIYGFATIIVSIIYRIAGWGLNPSFFIAVLAIGRFIELFCEKVNEVRKQMISQAILSHLHEFKADENDGKRN